MRASGVEVERPFRKQTPLGPPSLLLLRAWAGCTSVCRRHCRSVCGAFGWHFFCCCCCCCCNVQHVLAAAANKLMPSPFYGHLFKWLILFIHAHTHTQRALNIMLYEYEYRQLPPLSFICLFLSKFATWSHWAGTICSLQWGREFAISICEQTNGN